jgi:CheY-like chemotaxis protein
MAAEFGSNRNSDLAPLSSSLFPLDESADAQRLRSGPILLVEDNSGDVILVREALMEHHITNELCVVTDGQKAIEFLDDLHSGSLPECPALLILDLNLPRKTGREVLTHMRRIPRCDAIPVLVLSSSNAPADRQAAADLGANLYLRKPSDLVDFMQIGATIRQLLSIRTPPC